MPLNPALLTRGTESGYVLLDRYGIELRAVRAAGGSRQRWVPLGEVDPDLLAAFIATEDRRFYEHRGVDLRALARAARDALDAGRPRSGASTITMQLARLLVHPAGTRTLALKLQQLLWALRLERQLDKQTILEQYLNRVPLGQGAVGVDAAAALYYGASARDLSLGQAAELAGLARAPSADNPLVSPARAARRRSDVLARLARAGYAAPSAIERVDEEPVLSPGARDRLLAPHFTTRVVRGQERAGIAVAGEIRTSLDLALETELEADARHAVGALRERGARHASVVALDNRTGEILAWVGSPDFWADTAGQVDMVVSPRQPGSALKPFVYGLAFDRGLSAGSVVPDVPTVWPTAAGPYAPRNYDRRFHGPVRLREALASSYNVPAVVLASRLGIAAVHRELRSAGFMLPRPTDYYGLGLALGNGDVTLLELANAYRALAEGGIWRPWRMRAVHDGEAAPPGRRVMSGAAAALVLDVLADPLARVPGFGLDTPFDFPFPVAAKTGTSRHFTDNWAVGVTGGFTVAVWVGNFSGRPMDGVSGVSGAGPLLHRAVLAVSRRYPPGVLPSPAASGARPTALCRISGMLAGPSCPRLTEWTLPGASPAAPCDWHHDGAVTLPAEYADWSAALPNPVGARGDAAVSSTDLAIVSPRDGDVYRLPPGVERRYATVALRAVGADSPSAALRWFVDGRPFDGARWPLAPGAHRIGVVARSGAKSEVGVTVE